MFSRCFNHSTNCLNINVPQAQSLSHKIFTNRRRRAPPRGHGLELGEISPAAANHQLRQSSLSSAAASWPRISSRKPKTDSELQSRVLQSLPAAREPPRPDNLLKKLHGKVHEMAEGAGINDLVRGAHDGARVALSPPGQSAGPPGIRQQPRLLPLCVE
jgi:hypothetical protein